eukprot:gene27436-33817_t
MPNDSVWVGSAMPNDSVWMDGGSGNPSHGEMYVKGATQDDGKEGTVYVTFDHPAMAASVQGEPGSLLIDVEGLSPGRVYLYLLQSAREHSYGVEACGGNFTTSPLLGSGLSLRLWAIGDSGHSNEYQAAVKHAYLLQSGYKLTDAVLVLGDLAYDGGYEAEMDTSFFGSYQDLMSWIPFWTALGNHDVFNGLDPYPYYQLLTLPTEGEAGGHPSGTEAYYSFDLGQVHVVCLDSMDSVHRGTMAEMLAWLDQDLAAFRAAGAATHWLIAFFHHPPYSKGSHDSDVKVEMTRMREEVVPRLELAGVDLVISGHSHGYERSFLLKAFY